MSSKPAEPRSIASQLVLLFTVAAALLLVCGLGGFYLLVVRHAFEEDNAVLADKLFAVRAALKTPDGPRALYAQISTSLPGENVAYWVRVLNESGESVVESPGMNEILPNESFPAPTDTAAGRAKCVPVADDGGAGAA